MLSFKKVLMSGLCISMCLVTSIPAFATESVGDVNSQVAVVESLDINSERLQQRTIDLSKEVTVSGGGTWRKSFDVASFWGDHNTVDFFVTQVTGTYIVSIRDGSGHLYFESNEYTDSSSFYTMTNADPEETYTMTVINNVSDEDLKFKVQIESYVSE